MKYWFKNVADNIYIYPKSAPRNLILQIRTSDCNSAYIDDFNMIPQSITPKIPKKVEYKIFNPYFKIFRLASDIIIFFCKNDKEILIK